MTISVDALVRGAAGYSDTIVEGRVFRVSPFGWLALVDAEKRQWIVYPGRFEVIGPPRPAAARRDIPAVLQ